MKDACPSGRASAHLCASILKSLTVTLTRDAFCENLVELSTAAWSFCTLYYCSLSFYNLYQRSQLEATILVSQHCQLFANRFVK